MSAAGILRADRVVFYHPLDDYTEHTQGQTWTGSAAFSTGKIGDANSAIAGDAVSYGPDKDISANTSGWCGAWHSSIAEISATQALVCWSDGDNVVLSVGTVSGTDITFGPKRNLVDDSKSARASLSPLGSGRFIVSYKTPSGGVYVRVATVSGTDVTVTGDTLVEPGGDLASVATLSSTSAICQYRGGGGQKVKVLGINGSDVTLGPEVSVSADSGPTSVVALSSGSAVAVWQNSGIKCAAIAVSGLTATVGATVVVSSLSMWNNQYHNPAAVALDSTRFVVSYSPTVPIYGPRMRVGVVDGLGVTLGAEADTGSGGYTIALARASSGSFVAVSANEVCSATVGVVSGTDITLGSTTSAASVSNSGAPSVCVLDGSKVVIVNGTYSGGGKPVEVAVGNLEATASDMDAATPGAYPAASGSDRVVVAMWASKLGAGSSVITVQRDYTVTITASTIELGPATAVWNDGDIATLLGTLSGGEHMLVLDFEHTGSGNWNLRTSLDGGAFVNQGAQDSGSRTTSPTTLGPGVSIDGGESGQWVDELAMWSGDKSTFDSFTTQELANLYDLADTFGETMDQYSENYDAPICWQATATMPDGTVWRDSGSGPCPAVIRVPRGATDIVVTDEGRSMSPRIIEG